LITGLYFILCNRVFSNNIQIPIKDFNEPELFAQQKGSGIQVFRLMILPTWGDWFLVRIEKDNESIQLIIKQLNYRNRELVLDKKIPLTKEDFLYFEDLLVKSEYQKMQKEDSFAGLDGEMWIMEASRPENYHIVARWSPHTNKSIKKDFLILFYWAFNKANVQNLITNKGYSIFKNITP
jgi:hypothetical protein